jgi:sugar (pentulose or hexulose) kinase
VTGDLLLAIDHGTQSVRALAFDAGGTLVAGSRVAITPYVSPRPGWAEQDPEYFWDSVAAACRGLWQKGVAPEAVAGVALTTQRGTVVNVDAEGRALRPAILWLDQRRTGGLAPVGGAWGVAFRLAGLTRTVAYLQAEAEANWIRTRQPEIWARTHKYLFLSGFLTHRLTGRFVDSVGCQVGYVPFDYKRQHWSGKRDWKWSAVPMDPRWLPELVPPAGILGEVTRAASEATGIPAGRPVVAAAADKACEVLGSGALRPGLGCLSYGTTATVNVIHGKYKEPIPLLPAYPAAVPGGYNLEVQVYRGYWMVSWFKQEFGHHERGLAQQEGLEPEALFDRLVNEVPPGSMGLVLQPYWSPGLRSPGPEAKGAVVGFGDVHTRAHLYRAILEGLAYALREGLERIEGRTGRRIEQLRVAGGGSRSDAALQITADVFGLPAARPHVDESSGLGAAIITAVALGQHPDFETAVRAMTRTREVFEPQEPARGRYEALYRRVYLKMYDRLRPLYEDIREITGYPGAAAD